MNILYANSGDPDQTSHFAASDLGLHCLRMPHKKDAGLFGLKSVFTFIPAYNSCIIKCHLLITSAAYLRVQIISWKQCVYIVFNIG